VHGMGFAPVPCLCLACLGPCLYLVRSDENVPIIARGTPLQPTVHSPTDHRIYRHSMVTAHSHT